MRKRTENERSEEGVEKTLEFPRRVRDRQELIEKKREIKRMGVKEGQNRLL